MNDDENQTDEGITEGPSEETGNDPFAPLILHRLKVQEGHTLESSTLTAEQEARATALYHAKEVLGSTAVFKAPRAELFRVAEYILHGMDPTL